MAINEHPAPGTVLMCDFSGLTPPEMVKRRPVIVISPKIRARHGLCTVVALSTTAPQTPMAYHYKMVLPAPLDVDESWVKGDMVYTVSLQRLDLLRVGKDITGKRIYQYRTITADELRAVRSCVLHALGLASLTKHLP